MTDYANVNWGDAVDVALKDINDAKEARAAKPKTGKKEVDLTKYFSINLGEKEKTGKKFFRILPDPEDPKKFVSEVYFHHIQLDGKWVKLYDPSQNKKIKGVESPLNDARDALNASSDQALQKTASKYRPVLFYIIRGIERGKEHEGVKFWRFKATKDSAGIMDKIESVIGIYNALGAGKGAIWNPVAGRDLMIVTGKDAERGFTKVVNMMATDELPLSADAELAGQWLSDPIKWQDVYSQKSVEYLRIVANGEIPVWSKDAEGKGGYVAKVDDTAIPTASASAPVSNYAPVAAPAQPQEAVPTNGVTVDLGDDLPF